MCHPLDVALVRRTPYAVGARGRADRGRNRRARVNLNSLIFGMVVRLTLKMGALRYKIALWSQVSLRVLFSRKPTGARCLEG